MSPMSLFIVFGPNRPTGKNIPKPSWENVTLSDKIGLIAGKYMFLLNNVYLYLCVSYNNSVSFSKISINLYISDEKGK